MTDQVLKTEPAGDGVVLITLDRPHKRNALSAELRQELVTALASLADDDGCRVVVLTGAGGTFCAGFDLDELHGAADVASLFADADAYHGAVHNFPKPIIAAISGPAVAGGLDLALMCDIRIADGDARFGQPQVKFGVPAAYDLVRSVVAEPAARELCLTGRVIDAAEAERIGLVNQVVEDGSLLVALELAESIAAVPITQAIKQQILAAQPRLFGPDKSS